MKIGFVVSFFDFRNDVRRVIAQVARHHTVVVFGTARDAAITRRHLPQQSSFRVINEKKNTFGNYVWERIYFLFRRIPGSRHNFYLMEYFKASLAKERSQRLKNYLLIRLIKLLPRLISYDTYLDHLHYHSETNSSDIDHFVFFTAIADDYFLARLLTEKRSVRVYVYSWDHPCKHTCFSTRVKYNVWNAALGEDLAGLQRIPRKNIRISGSSQMAYIEEFLRKKRSLPCPYPFRYIYFGCAIGLETLARQEAIVIESIADQLAANRPDLRLVIRPYPFMRNTRQYEQLRLHPTVVLDDQYRTDDWSVSEEQISRKLNILHHAEAFFHLGSTMGLEACLIGTPSFLIDWDIPSSSPLSLYNFTHQYQNEKYLLCQSPANAIRSPDELKEVFLHLDDHRYTVLNNTIQTNFPLPSFEVLGSHFYLK